MSENYFQTFYSKLREGILAVCKASLESGIKGGSAPFEGSLWHFLSTENVLPHLRLTETLQIVNVIY